tara:strand:+ start:1137 stop:1358 length:222 start_codon:yes stop_codon:yes gene_type:complete
MKYPKTTGEHIVALYGHIKGLKTSINTIKTNDLRHIHQDIEGLHTKSDRLLFYIIGGLASAVGIIVGVLFKLL